MFFEYGNPPLLCDFWALYWHNWLYLIQLNANPYYVEKRWPYWHRYCINLTRSFTENKKIIFFSSCGEDMEASDYEFEDETRPAKVSSFWFPFYWFFKKISFYCFWYLFLLNKLSYIHVEIESHSVISDSLQPHGL